jgi:hypothetical protein
MSNTHEDTLAMMQGKTPKPQGKERDQWDERDKYFSTRRVVQVMFVLAIIAWLVLLGWVFFLADITKADVKALAVGADLSIILAPIIAAAAGVERMLETIFNVVEGSWKTLVAYLGYGFRWLKSAEVEVSEARQWLSHTAAIYNSTSAQYNAEMTGLMKLATDPNKPKLAVTNLSPETSQKMGVLAQEAATKTELMRQLMVAAQERLSAAESKLGGITDSEGYKSSKAAVSIVLGLMLGIIVAAIGQLQMFALLGIALVPAKIDVLITGLVIGSGSYPVHSLVGILQQGKNALDGLQGYLNNATPGSAKNAPTGQATSFPTAGPGPVAPFAATPAQAAAVETAAVIAQPVAFGLPMEPAASQPTQPPATPGPLG